MANQLVDFKIVHYLPEHRAQILELQKHHLSDDVSVSDAYLRWKYDQNPYLDKTHIYVGFVGSKVIGMVGAYGTMWHCGNPEQPFILPCFSDAVIHPDWRSQELFSALNNFALADLAEKTEFSYALDMSAMSSVAASLMMQGWRSPGFMQMAQWRRTKDHRANSIRRLEKTIPLVTPLFRHLRGQKKALVNRIARRPAASEGGPSKPFLHLDRIGVNRIGGSSAPITIDNRVRPPEMAELITRIGFSGCIEHVKDEVYFRWRYDNPLADYRFLYYGSGNSTPYRRLDGYIVLQTSRWAGGSANIVDWAAIDSRTLTELLEYTILNSKLKGLNLWSATVDGNVRSLLISMGFIFVNKTGRLSHDLERPTMLVTPINRTSNVGVAQKGNWQVEGKEMLQLTSWNLHMANSDNY